MASSWGEAVAAGDQKTQRLALWECESGPLAGGARRGEKGGGWAWGSAGLGGWRFSKERGGVGREVEEPLVELAGELFAVVGVFVEVVEPDGGLEVMFVEEIEQVGQKGHVAPITDLFAHVAVGQVVLDKGEGQRGLVADDGFEQCGFKRENGVTRGACAFGEEHDHDSGLEGGLDLPDCMCGLGTFVALDEQGARAAGEPAEERPTFHFVLGDEDARGEGGEEQNIEVAEVVGDDESTARYTARDTRPEADGAQDPAARVAEPDCARCCACRAGLEGALGGVADGGEGDLGEDPEEAADESEWMERP
jgi:hypothetical protein